MNRLKEPSTWAGIAALAQIAAGFLPLQYQWIAHAVTAGAGAAAVRLPETSNANAG